MYRDLASQPTQPVYVLGAGFSAAISDEMPLTNDIGREIQRRLDGKIDVSDLDSLDFEDWLSVRVSPMPHLEGHENQRRLADAQEAIAVIAEVVEERTNLAALQAVPMWLRQLVALWHLERALVVTFNYDTLLERAINDVRPVALRDNQTEDVRSEDVVFPAPTPPPAITYEDMEGSHRDSLQVLKVHGSINWYWNAGDPTGSSLTRTRERSRFEGRSGGDLDTSGTSYLDRFLIPPVATKSEYYTPPMTKILWRMAGAAVRTTTRLTLFGYSMPSTDRATTEMLRVAREETPIHIIDRFGDASSERGSVISRATGLFGIAPELWSGDDCAQSYVQTRMTRAAQELLDWLATDEVLGDTRSVVVALPAVARQRSRSNVSALAYFEGAIRPFEITGDGVARVGGGSAAEAALNSRPAGKLRMSDFVSVGQLRERADEDGLIVISDGPLRWMAIGAEEITLNRSRSVHLLVAPLPS